MSVQSILVAQIRPDAPCVCVCVCSLSLSLSFSPVSVQDFRVCVGKCVCVCRRVRESHRHVISLSSDLRREQRRTISQDHTHTHTGRVWGHLSYFGTTNISFFITSESREEQRRRVIGLPVDARRPLSRCYTTKNRSAAARPPRRRAAADDSKRINAFGSFSASGKDEPTHTNTHLCSHTPRLRLRPSDLREEKSAFITVIDRRAE